MSTAAQLSGDLAELRIEAVTQPASDKPADPPPAAAAGAGASDSGIPQPLAGGRTPDQVAAGVGEWRSLLELAVRFGSKVRPKLAEIYTPATIDELARALDAVAAKYGMGAFGFFDRYKEEITLGVLAWNLVPATLKAIKGDAPANDGAQPDVHQAAPAAAAAAAPAEGGLLSNNDKPYS